MAAVVLLTCGRAAEPIALKQEVSRAISPGETHVFETPAVAGQFLRFTLDASHTRLKATLRRPDGRAAIVLSDGRQHEPPVSLSWLADAAGSLALSLELPREEPAGKYTLRLTESRTATTADAKAVEGETALREGRVLFAAESGASRRAAIAKFQAAIGLASEAGDRVVERNALRSLGRTYNVLGRLAPGGGGVQRRARFRA